MSLCLSIQKRRFSDFFLFFDFERSSPSRSCWIFLQQVVQRRRPGRKRASLERMGLSSGAVAVFIVRISIVLLAVPTQSLVFRSSYLFSLSTSSHRTRMASSTPLAASSDVDLEQVLDVAIAASKKAGEIILGNAGGAEVTERKANSRDLLTLIDPLCEKVGVSEFFCIQI